MSSTKSPQLTLVYFSGACSLAPHVVLYELGIPFQTEVVTRTDDGLARWAKLNLKMRIPVLLMDGETITETPAIMTALAQLDPGRSLLGKSNLETVRVYEWMNWLSGTLHSQIWGQIFRPGRFVKDSSMHDAVVEQGLQTAKETYAAIEERLAGLHAVGDGFTVVDPYLYIFYRWAAGRQLVNAETHPKYTRFVTEIEKRASVVKTLEAEGLERLSTSKL